MCIFTTEERLKSKNVVRQTHFKIQFYIGKYVSRNDSLILKISMSPSIEGVYKVLSKAAGLTLSGRVTVQRSPTELYWGQTRVRVPDPRQAMSLYADQGRAPGRSIGLQAGSGGPRDSKMPQSGSVSGRLNPSEPSNPCQV